MFVVLAIRKKKEDKICINLNLTYMHNLDGPSFVKDKWMMNNSLKPLEDFIFLNLFSFYSFKHRAPLYQMADIIKKPW